MFDILTYFLLLSANSHVIYASFHLSSTFTANCSNDLAVLLFRQNACHHQEAWYCTKCTSQDTQRELKYNNKTQSNGRKLFASCK